MQFVNARINELGLSKKAVKHRYQYAFRGFDATLTGKQLKKLKKDPRVKYIEQDQWFQYVRVGKTSNRAITSVPTPKTSQQIIPWGVSRVNGPFDGTGKKAWIIGTGIDLQNTDLNVDIANSVNYVTGGNGSPQDNVGHGTYVAGLLAAKNNNKGIVGVAAGATVVAVKVLGANGGGTFGDVAAGINYVDGKASPNDIINLSLGGSISVRIDNAVIAGANEGLRFVISAGNEKESAENVSPAHVDHFNVWTVSAFRQGDTFSVVFDYNHCHHYNFGSNYGNPPVDYSEPGESLKSLLISGTGTVEVGMGYAGPCTASGTSYAAPMLSGILLAALYGIKTDGYVNNDPDGNLDPIGVADVSPPPLSVYIYGPFEVHPYENATWTAHPSDGTPPYQYSWDWRKKYDGSPWTNWSPINPLKTFGFTWNPEGPGPELKAMQLKVTVTDADNGQATSLIRTVHFVSAPGPFIQSDSAKTDSTAQ